MGDIGNTKIGLKLSKKEAFDSFSISPYDAEIRKPNELLQHLWIIEKESSKFLFYHNFFQVPELDGILLSGLLAALNNFSEYELENEGIENIDMGGLRWIYSSSNKCNLMFICASEKAGNPKLLRARLDVIKNLFISTYDISPIFWKNYDGVLNQFHDFSEIVDLLQEQWIMANHSMDAGTIFDILGVFQQNFITLINIMNTSFSRIIFIRSLQKLFLNLSELNEWMNTQTKYKDLNCIESFIPKINLDDYKILFDEVLGTSIFRVSPIGLNREILIPIFLKVVKLFKDVIETNLGKTGWMEVFLTKIKPYLLNHWNYLLKLELLKPLFNIYLN